MAGPLSKGQTIATLDRPWTWLDPKVQVKSEGKSFDNAEAAEGYARQLAAGTDVDSVVVKDARNRVWVYEVDELTRLDGANDLDADVRGHLVDLSIPKGVSLQGFWVSYRAAGSAAPGSPERVLAGKPAKENDAQIRAVIGALCAAGFCQAEIRALRGGLSREMLTRMQSRLQAAGNWQATALLPYVDAARAKLDRSGRSEIAFDELAFAGLPQGGGKDAVAPGGPEAAALQAEAPEFVDYPERLDGLRAAVKSAHKELTAEAHALSSHDQPVGRVGAACAKVEALEKALEGGKYREAAQLLKELPAVVLSASSRELSAEGRAAILRAGEKISAAVPRAEGKPPAPAAVVDRATAAFGAYRDQTELVLDGIFADGYAEFIDTFDGSQRVRPDDAACALLRINAAIWTVVRDLRRGTIDPSAFGKTNWDQVTAAVIYDLGMKRLRTKALDYDHATGGMLDDPIWRKMQIRDPKKGPFVLRPGAVNSTWKRSILSLLAPTKTAEDFEALSFARTMRDGTIRTASASGAKRIDFEKSALVTSAYAQFAGQGTEPNASEARLAVSVAAGVSIVDPKPAPQGATKEGLTKLQNKGEIAGFVPVGNTFIVYYQKPDSQIAAEVRKNITDHKLDGLTPEALLRLREMTGPDDKPGTTIEQHLKSEGRWRFGRQTASQAVEIAAIGIASAGIGTFVASAGLGYTGVSTAAELANISRGTAMLIKAAGLVANTATSSVLFQLANEGHVELKQLAVDAAMFGILSGAGQFSKLAGHLVPGTGLGARLVRMAAGQAMALASSDFIMTGYSVLEMSRHGQSPSFKQAAVIFGRNLAVLVLSEAVSGALSRVTGDLSPDAPFRRIATEHKKHVLEQQRQLAGTLQEYKDVTAEAATLSPDSPRASELAARAESLMQQVNAQRASIEETAHAVVKFMKNAKLPAPEITEALKEMGPAVEQSAAAGRIVPPAPAPAQKAETAPRAKAAKRANRPAESNEYAAVSKTINAVFADGKQLTPEELKAVAKDLALVNNIELRRLYKGIDQDLGPLTKVTPETVLTKLAEESGITPLAPSAVREILIANRPAHERVSGIVQSEIDRVMGQNQKLTPEEFKTWKQAFLSSQAVDRRHVAEQLLGKLGLRPAKQEEVVAKMAELAGLPESAAADVLPYRMGQDFKGTFSVTGRLGLSFINVGVSIGGGLGVRERNLVTGKQTPEVVLREGASFGVGRGSAMETTGKPHVQFGASASMPFTAGIGAGVDEFFGQVAQVKLGPLMNFMVGDGAIGGRLPLTPGAGGSGLGLGFGMSEPRLTPLTAPLRRGILAFGERASEAGEVFVGNFNDVGGLSHAGLSVLGAGADVPGLGFWIGGVSGFEPGPKPSPEKK